MVPWRKSSEVEERWRNPFLPDHLSWSRAEMEAECRGKYQSAYLGSQTLLCRVLGKYLMYVDASDIGIAPHLCLDGYWESWITQAVVRTIRPGWRCVDVGANHGYYSLLFADAVGPRGQVWACEPNPRMADFLERTLRANGFLGRTTIERRPLADTTMECSLAVPERFTMHASLKPADQPGLRVHTTSLDQMCEEVDRIDFVKIDVEGAEELVWRGLQETLRKSPEIILLLEFNDVRYADAEAFLDQIRAAGFPLRHVDFDSRIKAVSVDQVLNERPGEDWMLWLQRR
jgi:FkbM family methyltransferase